MVLWHRVPLGESEHTLDVLTDLSGLAIHGEDLKATVEEVAIATTLTANHFLVLVNGSVTIALPKAANHKERIYTIKNIGQGRVTIDPYSSETIDGEETIVLNFQYSFVTIVSDGSEWLIIGGVNVKMEEILKEIRDSLAKPLDKLIYLTGRLEKYAADENEGAELEKHTIEAELKDLEVDVRE